MRKEFNRHLILNGLLGCALPNGLINGALAYFGGHEKTYMGAALDISMTLFFVALLVTLIIIPVMRKIAHTIPDPGIERNDVKLFALLPTKTLALSLTLTVATVAIFGLLPAAVVAFMPEGVIHATAYAVLKGVYVGLASVPANYVATAMAKLTAPKRQSVPVSSK